MQWVYWTDPLANQSGVCGCSRVIFWVLGCFTPFLIQDVKTPSVHGSSLPTLAWPICSGSALRWCPGWELGGSCGWLLAGRFSMASRIAAQGATACFGQREVSEVDVSHFSETLVSDSTPYINTHKLVSTMAQIPTNNEINTQKPRASTIASVPHGIFCTARGRPWAKNPEPSSLVRFRGSKT